MYSINNERLIKVTAKEEARYTYEKQKIKDDAQHEKLMAISHEQEQKQRVIIYAIAFGLVLVLIFSFFIFNRLQVTRKQKALIEKQKVEVEEQKNIVEEKSEEILASISYAKRIQDAILPPIKLVKESLPNSFILYKPKDVVAGDFYWFRSEGDNIYYAAADCTGHGVPGALVSVVCANSLNRSVNEFGLKDPGKILDKTTELVVQTFEKSELDVKDGMDIGFVRINVKTKKLLFAGAHNPLYVFSKRTDQEFGEKDIYSDTHFLKEYKGDKQPVGKFTNQRPFTSTEVEIEKGDILYLFSDGFPDQFGGEKGRKFMYKPFKKLLLATVNESPDKQKEMIDQAFENWRGEMDQIDDVCVIGVTV